MPNYALTQDFEGWSPTIYTDTTGNPTIGYGFNLNDPMVSGMIGKKRKLTKEEAIPLFQAFYDRARTDAANAIGIETFNSLPPEAQDVFTDMSYNLGGVKFGKFKGMIQGARKQDWGTVSKEMQASKWYGQVGRRSKKLQGMIEGLNAPAQTPIEQPADFSTAFANARKQGVDTFVWNGKAYTTKVR